MSDNTQLTQANLKAAIRTVGELKRTIEKLTKEVKSSII